MADTRFIIDLIINARNNASQGMNSARQDLDKLTSSLENNESKTSKLVDSEEQLAKSIENADERLQKADQNREKSIKNLEKENTKLKEHKFLTDEDSKALLEYESASKRYAATLADTSKTGVERELQLFEAEKSIAKARDNLNDQLVRDARTREGAKRQIIFESFKAKEEIDLKAETSEKARLQRSIKTEQKRVVALKSIKEELLKIEQEVEQAKKQGATRAEQTILRAELTKDVMASKPTGYDLRSSRVVGKEGVYQPELGTIGQGKNQQSTLSKNELEMFIGRLRVATEEILRSAPSGGGDQSVLQIAASIGSLDQSIDDRTKKIDKQREATDGLTDSEQKLLDAEVAIFEAETDAKNLAQERSAIQSDQSVQLRQNAEEERRRAQEMADFVERTQALKADGEELGVNLRSEREKRFELEERRRAQEMADFVERRQSLTVGNQTFLNERAKKIHLEEIARGEEKVKLEKQNALDVEKALAKTYSDTKKLNTSQKKLEADKIKASGSKNVDEFTKIRLEYDQGQILELRQKLKTELRGLEAEVKLKPNKVSELRILALRAALGKDLDVNVKFDNKIGLIGLTKGAFGAFAESAAKATKSISSFDNVFRGLLVLGIVAFLGQLATGIILAASALTALVSSALSAAGALGGALVAGIGQALPAVGVLAAFGNRVSNVFDALKQSNLEQQQASYSGADAADTQAKSLSGVADAQKALTEARKTAKKALEDLIFAEKGQALSVEEAGFALQKAISSGGSMGVARAQLGVESANRDLAGTRSDISSRKKSGIEGSPEVVAAQKSLDQALQSANQGTASVGAAAGKLNYLVENLSKAEQRLLKALIRLQAAWREFAENITEPLTNSFTFAVNKVIKILDSKQILNAGKRLSTALGASFTQIFDALFSKNTVTRFLALGEEFAKNLKPITSIAIGLLNIFLNFAEAGGPALSLILGYLNDIVGALDRWSSSISGKKSLTDFFTEGSGSLKGVLDLLISIGNVILAIMGPAGGIKAGNTIIDQITGALNKFAEAIKDPTSKVGIFFKNFFDQGKNLLPLLGPIFSALGSLVETLISPGAIKAFENFADIIANSVVPGLEDFIIVAQVAFNLFATAAKTGVGEFIIKFGIAGALIAGLASKLKAVANPFFQMGKYIFNATGKLDLFNKSLKTTNALTAAAANTNPNLIAGRGAAKKSLQEGKSIAADAQGGATGAEVGAAMAADEAFDAARGASQRRSQKARDKALGKLGSGREDDVNKAFKEANKIDKIGDKAGLASAGSLLTKLANPAGLVLIAIAAITALIVGLIAYSGRLGDVWKQIKKTFNEVWASIKKGAGDIAKEITGKNSIKEAFSDISKFAKKVGNALADAVIWLTKAYGDVAKKQIEALVQTIIAVVRAVKWTIEAFKDVQHWLKEAGKDIRGFFTGIWDGILTGLESVTNGIISAVKRAADAFNKLPSAVRLGQTIDTSGLNPVDLKTSTEKAAEKRAVKAAQKADRENTYGRGSRRFDTSGVDSGVKSDTGTRRSPSASGEQRRTPGKDQSPARPKAATKADNKDATSFLNTFDPQTVQLSDAIVKKLSHYWRVLRKAAKDSVNDVIDFLKDLRGAKGSGRIDKFVTAAISDFKRLRTGVRVNMTGVTNIIKNQMQNSMEAVKDAATYMKKTLNEALKAVGADGDLIKLSVSAPPKIAGDAQAVATGGWIGNRGERGQDAVHTILGRGEAVLNWGQQKVVEPALRQVYGFGLDEMFGRTRGLHAGTGNVMGGRASGGRGNLFTQGKASWFGGPNDGMNIGTATGVPDTTPGIALYNAATKNKYFNVYAPNGRWHKERQIDFGPAPWTGKVLDITSAALSHFGFNEKNFPTGVGNWRVYGPVGGSGSQGGGGAEALKMPKITGADSPMGQFVSKGTKKMIDGAQKYLDKKTPAPVAAGGGGNLDVPAGTAGKIAQGIALAKSMGLSINSFNEGFSGDGVHTPSSWHYKSRAIDVGGSSSQMAAFFRAALKKFGKNILELFYDPLGAIKNGSAIPSVGDHSDHVHLALARGGRANMSSAYERRRIELARREKRAAQRMSGRAAQRMSGLKKYAHGGYVEGPEGQAVPIVAHAGEWVVNKMQQAKLAMMAGTTPDRVKGALGFGGGPTHFKDGGTVERNRSGSVRTVNKDGSLNLLDLPAFDIQSYFSSFQKAFDKAFMFIDKQIKTLSSSSRIERQIKQAEKRIERLKKGDESDKQQKVIDKLEERVKTLNEKLLKKDIDTLLKSIRKLTADGGAFSLLADKITRQFDRATSAANLAAVGLTKIGTRLKKLTTGKAFEKAIDPEEIAKAEARLQDLLSERLQNLRTDWVRTLKRVNNIIKKTKIGTSEKIQKTLQKLNGDVQSIQSKIDKAEEGDESEAEKKRIERLKKSLKAKKEQIKKQETNLKKRQALDAEAITAQDKITEIENKIIEAENAALEARKTAFEEATKKALKKTERNSVVASLRKSLAELGSAINLATGGIFNITNPVKTTIDALQSTAIEAQKKYDILKSRLAEAKKKALADPRWQSVVDDLEQQVGDSALAVVQTQADVVSGAIAAIDAQFQRGETTRALTERAAAVNERIGDNTAAFGQRLTVSTQKGAGLQTQLDLLNSLSKTGLNKQQKDDLANKIKDLEIAILENSQDTIDLTRQYRQAQLDLVTGKATRSTGLLGSVGTIFGNIAKAIGSTQSTASQITIAEQIRTALGLEQTGIIQQIIQGISDSNLGTEANTVLAQLQAAFSSGDPNSFATVLQALAPEIARLDSTLGTTAKATFDALVDSMINNTIATTDNTSNLAELNGLANQPQQFATTAWTKFRTALFNGVGDILPQFQVPQMATGGAITKGGLFQLHPGEFVINADKSNIPSDGPINITVNEANKPLDVTALASRIAFEKRTRR